jgi:hypothetical protein
MQGLTEIMSFSLSGTAGLTGVKQLNTAIFRTLLFVLVLPGFLNAVTIQKVSKIQAAGYVTFKANKSVPANTITWKATRYYMDESTNAVTYGTDTATAVGDLVQFNLQKTSGQYSFYKIFAYENGVADSITVQVFTAGVVQKYLYANATYSQYYIPVWIVLPTGYSSSSKFIMAMCGINRDASGIASYWVSFANTNNYVIVAPEFNSTNWSSDAYILGNMFTGSDGTGTLNAKTRWSFNIVEQMHKELYVNCGLSDSTYEMWGHSAGAQFVHRLAFFLPDNLITRYIAGNAGWYTCPDLTVTFPWGAYNTQLNLAQSDLVTYTNRKLVIMRGTADTVRDAALNTDAQSDAQGLNRYTRAAYFYNSGKTVNSSLSWKMVDVQGVGHDDQKMAVAGGKYILANPTSVNNEQRVVVEKFTIANYPNPFNPATQIVVSLPETSPVRITIYDLLGNQITTLYNDVLAAGNHNFTFNAAHLASGIYICRVQGEGYNATIKMQLIK